MKHSDEKKNKILHAGYILFDQFGYNGTAINKITETADVSKGSFYYYFKSKEDFAVQVLDYYTQMLFSLDEEVKNLELSPKEIIVKQYDILIRNLVSKSGLQYGGFARKLLQETREISPAIKKAVNRIFDLVLQSHLYILMQVYPHDYPKYKLKLKAELIIFAWEGAISRMKSVGNFQPLFDFKEMLSIILNETP